MPIRTRMVYRRMRDTMALLKMLAHAEADVSAGRTISTEQAFDRASAAIAGARDDA